MNKPIQHIENTWNTPYLFNDFGGVKILYPERTVRSAELDEETGLYYYGARYYEPRISLWLSVDPLAEQTMTPYQYTYQNPVKYVNPTGMKLDDWYRGKDEKVHYNDNKKGVGSSGRFI
ncbi:MAG: RHS repeat-associated core domain-containing protein [Flavobacteriales bacterium]